MGTLLKGSYNTYLGQNCRLNVVNSTEDVQEIEIGMKRDDGTTPLEGYRYSIPPLGLLDIDLCVNDYPDSYGVVSVLSSFNANTANLLRIGAADSYRFPVPLRQ